MLSRAENSLFRSMGKNEQERFVEFKAIDFLVRFSFLRANMASFTNEEQTMQSIHGFKGGSRLNNTLSEYDALNKQIATAATDAKEMPSLLSQKAQLQAEIRFAVLPEKKRLTRNEINRIKYTVAALDAPLKAQVWAIVNATEMAPELYNELATEVFPEFASQKILTGLTVYQEQELTSELNRAQNADLTAFKASYRDNGKRSPVNAKVASALMGLNLTRDLHAKIHGAFMRNLHTPYRFSLVGISAADYQGLRDVRSLQLALGKQAFAVTNSSNSLTALPNDVLSHINTFIGPVSFGQMPVNDYLNQYSKAKVEVIAEPKVTKKLSAKAAAKAMAKTMALINPVELKAPKTRLGTKARNFFANLPFKAEHMFASVISLYVASLMLLFEAYSLLFVPAVMLACVFVAMVIAKDPNAIKQGLLNFMQASLHPALNASAIMLGAAFAFLAYQFNIWPLMVLPSLVVLLVVVRPMVAQVLNMSINDTKGKVLATTDVQGVHMPADALMRGAAFKELSAAEQIASEMPTASSASACS